jgi:predicted phage-related endonuclease
MIAYKEIEQKSEEWFIMKWSKIGGTLSKGLHTKGDTLFIDILSQKIEEFEPSDGFTSEAMERGNELEPFAIEYLEKYAGVKFEAFGWLQSEENSLLGISPDGLTEDHTMACETKCMQRKAHTKVLLTNEIPTEYIHQCIHYFTVNPKLEKLYFCAFRTESLKSFVKELTLDSIVNVGTEKTPKLFSIRHVRDLSIKLANELENRINDTIEELKF